MTRVSSGRATICRPAPGWPFCPPCGRPGRARRLPALAFAFAPAAGLSWLGGREEFEESRPACRRSAATSARSVSISAACSATTASSSATRAVSSAFPAASSAFRAASSSCDGCSGYGTPEPNHDHKPDASTDTPQINRGPDWLPPRVASTAAILTLTALLSAFVNLDVAVVVALPVALGVAERQGLSPGRLAVA